MKKLGKISISPEKVIKNEELVNLRGGDEYGDHWVECSCGGGGVTTSCNSEFVRAICNSYCEPGWTAICV